MLIYRHTSFWCVGMQFTCNHRTISYQLLQLIVNGTEIIVQGIPVLTTELTWMHRHSEPVGFVQTTFQGGFSEIYYLVTLHLTANLISTGHI